MPNKYKYTKTFTYEGKRYYVYGNTLDEVYSRKAEKLRNLEEGRIILSGSMLLKDWVPICLETYKPDQTEDVKKEWERRIDKYVLSELGNYRLKDITPIMCQRIISAQSGMSKSHISKLSQEMHFIFQKALKNKYIFENPADDMILPKGTENNRRSITEEERQAFLRALQNFENFQAYELMLYCGCRPSEALECRSDDIMIVDGKPLLHIRGTKTRLSDRIVPLPGNLYDKFKDRKGLLAPNTHGSKYTKKGYARLSQRLKREMNIAMGCEIYRNALVPPLPLAEDFVPYCFRHTYCTDLQKAGVDVRVAQKLMGHSSIEITANIYTHVDMSDILHAADLIKIHRCTTH